MADILLTRRRPLTAGQTITASLLAAFVLLAILAPLLVPYDPVSTNPPLSLKPPSLEHWFGTDQLGRDIFSRTLAAAQVDLAMAFSAVAASLLLGSLLGALAGWSGGWIDAVVTRVLDTIMAFPLFVLAEHRGLRGQKLRQSVIEALSSVRIPDPERRYAAYPGELSGGMCQRVMLAIAMAGNPALLIADEPTTGLDTTTQAAILELILEQARTRGMACLLITHDLALARQFAERVIVMHAGQIVEEGLTASLYAGARHPYTTALLRATPADAATVEDLQGIAGSFPDLRQPVPACRFAKRCERALVQCSAERPPLTGADAHRTACWKPLP